MIDDNLPLNIGCGEGYIGIFPICIGAPNFITAPIIPTQPTPTPQPQQPEPNQYLANQWEVFFGCKEGYTRPQFGDYCVKQVSPLTSGATDWAKYVPYVVIGFILLMLFGRR